MIRKNTTKYVFPKNKKSTKNFNLFVLLCMLVLISMYYFCASELGESIFEILSLIPDFCEKLVFQFRNRRYSGRHFDGASSIGISAHPFSPNFSFPKPILKEVIDGNAHVKISCRNSMASLMVTLSPAGISTFKERYLVQRSRSEYFLEGIIYSHGSRCLSQDHIDSSHHRPQRKVILRNRTKWDF